uniref:Uncharacterized protein n=1 Tax=Arundo donax TaxID=35708 RepID=A0A0A9FED5_ARUDO
MGRKKNQVPPFH